MVFHLHERGTQVFVPLTLAEVARGLVPDQRVQINLHTRVTSGLGFGGPCNGTIGVVVIESHGSTEPKEVMAVRCIADGCNAVFFP